MPSVRAKKTHADYCLSVCFLCFCRSKDMRKINSKQWETIEKYLVSGLNREDERLPKVLCSTCRLAVSEYARGIFDRDINLFDHSKVEGSSLITRDHTCLVCEIGSASLKDYLSLHSPKSPIGRPSTTSAFHLPSAITLCSFCLSEISKGKPHVCTKTSRVDNLKSIINCCDDNTGEKLASYVIKDKALKSEDKENIPLTQSAGQAMKVKIVKKANESKKGTLFTHDDILKIKTSRGMSLRGTLELAQNLRSASKNRKVISPGLSEIIKKEATHKLDGKYAIKNVDDFVKAHNDVPVIYCNNINECLNVIACERGISLAESDLKVGIDAGGGFLKVCLNVMTPVNDNEPSASVKKRLKYEDGIAAKSMKSTSVNKLLILAITPGVPENYDNIFKVLELLKLEDLPETSKVRYAADLKMINLLLGLMSHSSAHPCSWCDMDR